MEESKNYENGGCKTDATEISCLVDVSKKSTQFLAAFIATLAALCAGTCLSWSSSAIIMLKDGAYGVELSKADESWISSLVTLGAFLGAIPGGHIVSYLGRKRTLQLMAAPLYASWMLIAFGGYIPCLYVARVLAGFAIGVISVAAPMYVAELSEALVRGSLGTFFQVQITIGLLVGYVLGGWCNFKWLAISSSIPIIIFLTLFSFMPETPVYLYQKGKIREASHSLQWFRGENYNMEKEMMEIKKSIEEANTNKISFSDLVRSKAAVKGLIITMGLMVFQQLSGINAVLFFAGEIFSESGTSISSSVCAVIIGAIQVMATLMSTFLIEKLGRKVLLLISAFVMCASLTALGMYFYFKEYKDLSYLSILPLICVGIFIIVFSIGFGPIPWMMVGEIFDSKTKGLAGSTGAAFNWLLAFTVTSQFQNLSDALGRGITFIIFGCICAIGFLFVLLLVPETKGKTVPEVQMILVGAERKKIAKTVSCNNETNV